MISVDTTQKYCVVGAGSSGICIAKWFRQLGVPCDVIEREEDVGGNWWFGKPHSAVCQSTHLISSKRMTEYRDYPMPDTYPDYPSHRLVLAYLRDYARHFEVYPLIQFNRSIERIERADDGCWDMLLDGGERRQYGGLVVANGHNWDAKRPEYPGTFDGLQLHSAQYKTPDVIRGKRVLVVGAGNSGCDIAVESAQNAAKTFHSSRRGYHYYPKYFLGMPADALNERFLKWRLPLWLRRMTGSMLVKMVLGWPQDYGLPKPDHKLFESHPIVNSQMLYYVGHGDIHVKPDVAELCGDRVKFVDGSVEEIDVIIYATGFKTSFPFLDVKYLNHNGQKPDLYLNVFHPEYDNLFVVGMIQPDSGQFGLVDDQSQAVARFVVAQQQGNRGAEAFRRRKRGEKLDLGNGIHYLRSARHLLEIEHSTYRRHLQRAIAELS
jgi:cation diffusion facilitator CzcD-associated flavoprotein CzcO